ncbi:hypothetical protein DICPUDRAFT_76208 [Dictyostelium purpureum]|uniref:Uncharacterized protein n=1 Tax=Dictyostelium purpureum TaxID=5786 RepID=F0ZCX6_DICPU|nr:uncharacterized protein DICPUDRAFT_76208 [Dictyostelium purpureum]EGC38215.1 hypothetical protein DICPUDRAFT_76208 [Dictyostelium purpureum]|eukprot:XP_003285253.1 hypothetical protein DICPUDRAFT_76208 [Dictyostelium purpureum]
MAKREKKRKLPYQIDKFPSHTFHYYSPPNSNKEMYNFQLSNELPFPSPPPSPSLSSVDDEHSDKILYNEENSINTLDLGSKKKQKVDGETLNKMFQELNDNRKEMNCSLNNFQILNNNLFVNTNKGLEESNEGEKDNGIEQKEVEGLFSFLGDDQEINLNYFNDSSNSSLETNYDENFLSPSPNTTTLSPSPTNNPQYLLYDGDSFDKVLENLSQCNN